MTELVQAPDPDGLHAEIRALRDEILALRAEVAVRIRVADLFYEAGRADALGEVPRIPATHRRPRHLARHLKIIRVVAIGSIIGASAAAGLLALTTHLPAAKLGYQPDIFRAETRATPRSGQHNDLIARRHQGPAGPQRLGEELLESDTSVAAAQPGIRVPRGQVAQLRQAGVKGVKAGQQKVDMPRLRVVGNQDLGRLPLLGQCPPLPRQAGPLRRVTAGVLPLGQAADHPPGHICVQQGH